METITPEWVRSQLFRAPEIRTPFGWRRVTYADHVASGQPLVFIEDLLRRRVHPL